MRTPQSCTINSAIDLVAIMPCQGGGGIGLRRRSDCKTERRFLSELRAAVMAFVQLHVVACDASSTRAATGRGEALAPLAALAALASRAKSCRWYSWRCDVYRWMLVSVDISSPLRINEPFARLVVSQARTKPPLTNPSIAAAKLQQNAIPSPSLISHL